MTIEARFKSGAAICLLTLLCHGAQAAENSASLQGLVTNKAGQPVAGAFVKAKNSERRLTLMVVSQDGGTFQVGGLPPGHYTVQGVGGNFQSNWSAPVDAFDGKVSKLNLSLTAERAPSLPHAWPGRLTEEEAKAQGLGASTPEDMLGGTGPAGSSSEPTADAANSLPPGEGKELVQSKCAVCHDFTRIKIFRLALAGWRHYVANMRANMAIANIPDITDAEANTISKYLVANYHPEKSYDENSRLPTVLMQGEARRYRTVTYDLPREFSEPHDIAVDPTGIAWAGEHAGRLLRFDPRTLEASEVNLPPGPASPEHQRLGNPQIDGNGILWAADGPNKRWLSFDTGKQQFIAYLFPEGHGAAGGNSMALAGDGLIWSTGGRGVRNLNPQTQEWRFFDSPSANLNAGAYGIAVAGDGAVWWAENGIDKMARLDPKNGKVEELRIPAIGRIIPRRMNSDAEGNIWVGLWDAGKLMRIDYKTKKMTLFTPPTKVTGNYSVVADKKNNFVWVSEQAADLIARFDPKTEHWVEFPLARAESDPRRIEIDPTNPNRIFFSGNTANLVGFVEYLPDPR